MENIMPDLKSELSKVITSWNDDMPTPTPTTSNLGRRITANSTRITFNYVRDNPGVTRSEAVAELDRLGVKLSSSSSLIAVMVKRGNIRRADDGGLFATQPEYKPLSVLKPRVTTKKAPPVVEAPTPVQINSAWDAETLLNNLSIKQARALYDELRKIFGG
jgi:hypothetical protein